MFEIKMKGIGIYLLMLLINEYFQQLKCCNEAVCRSVVSKCLLLKSCMCIPSNYTCRKACFDCLGSYNSQCCACLDFCPKSPEILSKLDSQSHVEDFPEPIPELFRALTEYPDDLNRWTTFTFPAHVRTNKKLSSSISSNYNQLLHQNNGKKVSGIGLGEDNKSFIMKQQSTVNCTVIFLNHCVSLAKCKRSCLTMGANSYRWFYNGCCECIGEHCFYHGVESSRCGNCPGDYEEEEEEDYNFDYFDE